MTKNPALALVAALAFVALMMPARMAFATVTCTIQNTAFIFNPYDPMSGADDTLPTGSVSVRCTNNSGQSGFVLYQLTLATSPARSMTSAGNPLTYDLYTNTPPTTQWNITNKLSCFFTVTANSTVTDTCDFYGKIAGGQNAPAGNYTQTGLAVGGTWSCFGGGC